MNRDKYLKLAAVYKLQRKYLAAEDRIVILESQLREAIDIIEEVDGCSRGHWCFTEEIKRLKEYLPDE